MTNQEIYNAIENKKFRSAWQKGVKEYALELLETVINEGWDVTHKNLLAGAEDWKRFSEGGCALIYDGDIAERLCNKTELKKTRNGQKDPNPRETWLDVQTRALQQAEMLIMETARG